VTLLRPFAKYEGSIPSTTSENGMIIKDTESVDIHTSWAHAHVSLSAGD
jgi:hypothetical protein